jgi:hypothetical protein
MMSVGCSPLMQFVSALSRMVCLIFATAGSMNGETIGFGRYASCLCAGEATVMWLGQ